MFIMPVPADETMFYPLKANAKCPDRLKVDVGFVKHGHANHEAVYEDFMGQLQKTMPDNITRDKITSAMEKMYRRTCHNNELRFYDQQMRQMIWEYVDRPDNIEQEQAIKSMVQQFCHSVYSAAWRCRFLEALDKAKIELGLFGNDWEKHKQLSHLARGAVNRQKDLNFVYNFNKINLQIHHFSTMHQRNSECGLAGGFMMIADHPAEKDGESVRKYFTPDKEVVMFETPEELLEKTRYYLDHEQERLDIAANMHKRALAEQTCLVAAEKILQHWRKLLNNRTLTI